MTDRDAIVAAIMRREKTANSSLLAEWEAEGEALPVVGDRYTVLDAQQRGVGVVEVTGVAVMAIGDADLQHALDEGEGFTSLAEWREAHEALWNGGAPMADATPIVVERFKVVRRFSAPG